MSYFTTHLSVTLLVKEFLRLGNIRRSYRQNGWLCHTPPFTFHFCPQRCRSRQISWITCVLRTETGINHCYVNKQINVSQLSRNINCCRPVLTYWMRDWGCQWLTDCWSCTAFCRDSFSLLEQLCTVGHGIFYMADVNNFLLVN